MASKAETIADYEYSLGKYVNKKNVILIFAIQPKAANFLTQLTVFKEQYQWLRDRDAVLYYVFEDEAGRADDLILREVDGQSLRKKFQISNNEFRVVIVNQAGKVVLRKESPQSLEDFEKILKK
jgi:hypothetical protein